MEETNKITGVRQHFQPIVDLKTLDVKHHEVLIRSIDDANPMDVQAFINDLEHRGDIHLLDQWSLRSLLTSHQSGMIPPGHSFAVNISAFSIENPAFQRWFTSFCQHAKGQIDMILEITETSPISNFSIINSFCEISKASGFEIAIDDFGSGYADATYLENIETDHLKLDGSLIRNMDSPDTWERLQETMAKCRELGVRVIAEQIEIPSQMKQAKLLGCEFGQGYLFGKPEKYLQDKSQITKNFAATRANLPSMPKSGESITLSH